MKSKGFRIVMEIKNAKQQENTLRGGSWETEYLRMAYRNGVFSSYKFCDYGFRIVMEIKKE